MNAIRFVIGFAAGPADSFCTIQTRNSILRIVRHTGRRSDGFDLACDLCSAGRRFRQSFIPRKHYGGAADHSAPIDFDLDKATR